MTQEAKIIYDLSDITGIRLVCTNTKCDCEVVRRPSSMVDLTSRCPECGTSWDCGVITEAQKIVLAISRIVSYKNMPVNLRLEMNVPDDEEN